MIFSKRTLTGFGFLVLLSFAVWVGGYINFSMTALSYQSDQVKDKSDAIVVLTGGNYRIRTGLDAFADRRAPKLFITGVHPSVSLQKIKGRWRGNKPLPKCCIVLDYNATNTLENAQEAKNWIEGQGHKSIHLVTSTYHMRRSLMEIRHIMPDLKIIPYPVPYKDYEPNSQRFWLMTFSEYHKWIWRSVTLRSPNFVKEALA